MSAASPANGTASQDGQVYCTLVMTDSYLPGACVLAHSLRDAGTQKKLAVLITPETLSEDSISGLRELYDYVIPVDRTANPHPANLQILARPDLLYTFTKIELWNLTQFSKIVYLDADVVALQAPDELFDLSVDFAAAPDVGWPDAFNSGVMVLKPDPTRYAELTELALAGESFDGADQGLLNQYFDKKGWHRISFAYNCTPNAEYQWEPAFRHYRRNIKLVHFIGRHKPWTMTNVTGGSGVYRELLSHWFAVRDRHSGSWQAWAKGGSRSGVTGLSYSGPGAHALDRGSSWNPTVSAPPANSRPEAESLPTQIYYSFAEPPSSSNGAQAFTAPRSYPPPPKNLGFDLPSTKPISPDAAPQPLFPWEFAAQTEKASRVFDDLESTGSDDETAASTLSESEDEAGPAEDSPSTVTAEPTVEPKVETEIEAEVVLSAPVVAPVGFRGRARERSESQPAETAPTDAKRAGHYHSMTGLSFRPELNAWDADPVIRQYMHTIMVRHESHQAQLQSELSDQKGFLPSYPSYKHVASTRSIPDLKSPPEIGSAVEVAEVEVEVGERDELQAEGSDGRLDELDVDLTDLPLRSFEKPDGLSRSVSESRSVTGSVSNVTVVGEDRKTGRAEPIPCPNCGFHAHQTTAEQVEI